MLYHTLHCIYVYACKYVYINKYTRRDSTSQTLPNAQTGNVDTQAIPQRIRHTLALVVSDGKYNSPLGNFKEPFQEVLGDLLIPNNSLGNISNTRIFVMFDKTS